MLRPTILLALTTVGCSGTPIRTSDRDLTIRKADPMTSVSAICDFFRARGKKVLTFTGYSAAGYGDEASMLEAARAVLATWDPAATIVNIGATPEGIGAVYPMAKSMGFETTGIVSALAREDGASISPDADHVFFVDDETWGGFLEGTNELSPTSRAMVEASDAFVSIGGGAVARDELRVARRLGKTVTYIPADMDHQKAREKAQKKGLPAPTDFGGAVGEIFAE